MPPRTLVKWLEHQVFNRDCRKIEVRHLSGRGNPILHEDLGDTPSEADVGIMAHEIENVCQEDANGVGNLQRYAVIAKRRDAREIARYVVRAASEDESANDFSDDGSLKSIVAQQMRHNEAIMRLFTASQSNTLDYMGRTIEDQNRRIEAHEARRVEAMRLTEELIDRRHYRELSAQDQEFKEQLAMEAFSQVKPLLPVVAAKIMGESADIGNPAIKNFLDSLEPEQLDSILKVLSPQQRELIMTLVKSINQEENGKAH